MLCWGSGMSEGEGRTEGLEVIARSFRVPWTQEPGRALGRAGMGPLGAHWRPLVAEGKQAVGGQGQT